MQRGSGNTYKKDNALATRSDGEPNRVELGIINVLRHQNHMENVGAIPVEKLDRNI